MRIFFLLLLITIAPLCTGDEIKETTSEVQTATSTALSSGSNIVERELLCIRQNTDGQEFIKQDQAVEMIKLLSKPMQTGFKKFGFTPLARALYYAQAIEESGGFTQLSEAKKFATEGNDPIAHMVTAFDNDSDFEASAKKKAFASQSFGQFRGRGLIQITGCDNYLSVIHYLNQMYGKQTPQWKPFWDYPLGNGRKQIGAVCTREQQRRMQAEYWNTQKMNPNLYGAFMDPMKFASIGMTLTDPVSKKKMDSDQFMVDASLAYWEGRCGERVSHATSKMALDKYAPCSKFKGDYLDRASMCITECIRGTTSGWERRSMWLKKALHCMQR